MIRENPEMAVPKTPSAAPSQTVDYVRTAEGFFDVQERYVFGGTR
jgi:hypothetical protein